MEPNKLKRHWAEGRPTLNGWLSIGNAFVAEILAEQGFDSLTVDLQHGFLDYTDAAAMLQAMRASGVVPMARVPWLEPGIVMKALDAGALGIICPMINTAGEAAQLVACMRYPPLGRRSFGPTRAVYAHGGDYAAAANGQVMAIAMIETAEAVRNAAEICATPGLDGIYVGPADLTLGVTEGRLAPGLDRAEPEMTEVIRAVLATAKDAGIRAGIHCGSVAYAARAVRWGFDMVTIAGDVRLLAAGAAQAVADARQALRGDG